MPEADFTHRSARKMAPSAGEACKISARAQYLTHSLLEISEMKESLVMTLIGKDRPGLVQSLSAVVEAHDGSWQASRMVHLAGEFAGLLSIEVPQNKSAALKSALGDLPGVTVHISRGTSVAGDGHTRSLEVVAQDRPGIVRQVTEVISSLDLNIEELESEVVSAPMSAELHFKATARLSGSNSAFDALQDRLEDLGAEIMVDLKDD